MTDMKDSIINSITGDINKLFEDKNNTFTKKEFADTILIAARYAYDTYYSNKKTKKNKNTEDKPKKELSKYQLFMKEQMKILKEENKDKKPNELMKEIAQMWKIKKEEDAK